MDHREVNCCLCQHYQLLKQHVLYFSKKKVREKFWKLAGNLKIESTALFSKTGNAKGCSECGNRGHVKEKCWQIIGYPQWHPKAKKFPQKRDDKAQAYKGKSKGFNGGKLAANAEINRAQAADNPLTQTQIEQLQQLLKLLPQSQGNKQCDAETDEELDTNFAGMTLCTHAAVNKSEWILDSGATDHMTYNTEHLSDIKVLHEKSKITLPNGNSSEISSIGTVKLSADIELQDVLYVPVFKYNLLSIPILTRHSNYVIIFYPKFCIIHDYVNNKILGIGGEHRGLYYLKD